MKRYLFAVAALAALCLSLVFGDELLARCRCDRGDRGAKRQARMERKAARRGESCASYVDYQPDGGTGYPDAVQPLGAAAATDQPRFQWVCDGTRCRLVPIATPDAISKVATPKATPPPDPQVTPGSAIPTFD